MCSRRYPLQSPAAPQQRIACDIPPLADPPALVRWLGIGLARLDSLASDWRQSTPRSDDRYHYRLTEKPSGGIRLLEIPKLRLREIQRQIHLGTLQHVPLHEACHGFRRKHSTRGGYALPHCNRPLVMHFDLKRFFNSIGSRRIHGLFSALGWPERGQRAERDLYASHGIEHYPAAAKSGWVDAPRAGRGDGERASQPAALRIRHVKGDTAQLRPRWLRESESRGRRGFPSASSWSHRVCPVSEPETRTKAAGCLPRRRSHFLKSCVGFQKTRIQADTGSHPITWNRR